MRYSFEDELLRLIDAEASALAHETLAKADGDPFKFGQASGKYLGLLRAKEMVLQIISGAEEEESKI